MSIELTRSAEALAASAALSSTYKPLAGDSLWLDLGQMVLWGGSAALSTLQRRPAWLFDASGVEGIAGSFYVPPGWATYHVDLWWADGTGSGGDVVWQIGLSANDAGDTLGLPAGQPLVTVAAGGANELVVSRAVASFSVSADHYTAMNITRLGNQAADTVANDVALLGVRIVRAS